MTEDKAKTPEQVYELMNSMANHMPMIHTLTYLGQQVNGFEYGIHVTYQCPSCYQFHSEVICGPTAADAFANAVTLLSEVIREFGEKEHN